MQYNKIPNSERWNKDVRNELIAAPSQWTLPEDMEPTIVMQPLQPQVDPPQYRLNNCIPRAECSSTSPTLRNTDTQVIVDVVLILVTVVQHMVCPIHNNAGSVWKHDSAWKGTPGL